jgi:hypothetical protein
VFFGRLFGSLFSPDPGIPDVPEEPQIIMQGGRVVRKMVRAKASYHSAAVLSMEAEISLIFHHVMMVHQT